MFVLLQEYLHLKLELINVNSYDTGIIDTTLICHLRRVAKTYKIGRDACHLWNQNMGNLHQVVPMLNILY